MKYILPLIVLLAVYLTPLYPLYAVESSSSASPRPTLNNRGALIDQRKTNVVERRDNLRERAATRSAAFKLKLGKFKDKNKAMVIERVNELLANINTKMTDHMKKHLDRLTEILAKARARADLTDASDTDKEAANQSFNDAEAAINEAKIAVDAQALMDYTINISSESAAKAEAKVARDNLHSDLKSVKDKIITARKALSDSIRLAASTLGGVGNGQ